MKEVKDIVYKNPFPVTAVANFYNNMQNDMIVETKAIKKLKEKIDKWILDENDGITIAVQGEYGTGKTQLAIEMQRFIKKKDEKKYYFICLESPSASFLEMYINRFLNEITKEQVLEKLEECYYEIIFNNIRQDEIYSKVIQKKGNIKSTELIERFGLAKSKYDLKFEEQLQEATKNIKFVPALLLLLETKFEKEVWEWFCGSDPSEAMKERGVNFSINDDVIALEAIGVFAFLFGQRGHTFVLFIDEMEKIVSNTDKTKKSSFNALKKLIETVKVTRSMLILCGLPDYYIALPKDTQQRIAYQIKTDEITLSEIEEYICNANEKVNKVKTYIPFSQKNLKEILDISNGNIRTIIRLLYHSGDWYIDHSSEIDENAFCDILTNAYGESNLRGIKRRLEQIFVSKGWLFEERKCVKNNTSVLIDFWLPSVVTKKGTLENGIEIYLVQNVLSEENFRQVSERIYNKECNYKICIVEGFINEYFYKSLSELNIHVLRYKITEFNELFISVIEGEKAKCENNLKQNDFRLINEKIEQLSRIINSAINDIYEKSISKQEFYYFARKFFDVQGENFYSLPEKDSEFYLLIHEIENIINTFDKKVKEVGVLYLFREFSYVLYYIIEKPQKLQISITSVDISEIFRNLNRLLELFSRSFGSLFVKTLDKYFFILHYLSYDYHDKMDIMYRYKENDKDMFLLDTIYDDDFFVASNKLKQISQNFCAELLIQYPQIIERYDQIFTSVYYFIYVTEPAIVRGERVKFDTEILLEYFDLLRKHFSSIKMYDSGNALRNLLENYESGLRRMINEREY